MIFADICDIISILQRKGACIMELSIDNIPFVSMAMAHENVMAAVGTHMLEASLDLAATEVSDLTKAMELSVNPAVGANFDAAV